MKGNWKKLSVSRFFFQLVITSRLVKLAKTDKELFCPSTKSRDIFSYWRFTTIAGMRKDTRLVLFKSFDTKILNSP